MSDQLFPHTGFGYRLEFKDKADKKICWFCHPSHVTKYIERYKIDINECHIDVHSDYPAIEGLTTKKTSKTATTKKPKKQKLFADLDTYVKIKEPETKPKRSRKASPAAPRSARKTPQAPPKGQSTQEAPRLLSDRFKASKK